MSSEREVATIAEIVALFADYRKDPSYEEVDLLNEIEAVLVDNGFLDSFNYDEGDDDGDATE